MAVITANLLDRAQSLFQSKLYRSCHQLISIELFHLLKDADLARSLFLAAECLFQLGDYGRALDHLTKCEQLVKQGFDDQNYDGKLNEDDLVSGNGLARIHGKIAACLMARGDYSAAKSVLVAIPVNMRDIQCWKCLARCHETIGELRDAAWAWSGVLRLEPYAYEALEKITALGFRESIDVNNVDLTDTNILKRLFEVDLMVRKFQYAEAVSALAEMLQKYPSNPDIKLRLATALCKNEKKREAYIIFKDLFAQNQFMIKGRDIYGGVLLSLGKITELSQLASSVLSEESKNNLHQYAETWIVLARYCEANNQLERALVYTEKALYIDNQHVETLMVRGYLLNKMDKYVDALTCFKKAHKILPDADTYRSLVNICVNLKKTREALAITKEMSHYLGGNEKTPICVGNVLQMAGQHAAAASAFQTALNRNPESMDAIFGLVNILCVQSDYDTAIRVLEKYQTLFHADWLHVRLGEIHLSKKDLQSALYHFIIALSINPECEKAKKGANQIESELRGDGTVEDDGSAMTQDEPADVDDDDSFM